MTPPQRWLVGVDIGGTFTDFVAWDGATLRTHKVLSTPEEPGAALLAGLRELGIGAAEIVHGSTVATNALLERKGARTALLTTDGFRDVLELGRQNRPHLYRLLQPPVEPLVPRAWRWEVAERLDEAGKALLPLDEGAVEQIAGEIEAAGIESLGIVFLFSYLDPTHERRAAELLRRYLPDLPLTLSSELLPEPREWERTATVAINAYVQPPIARYLRQLAERLGEGRRLQVMQSNGGVLPAAQAATEAARLALSGPAGGVSGAFRLQQQTATRPHLLTLDMGGTSTDVALCPGHIPMTTETTLAGLPLRLPLIDIHTVGAGGGSIAWVDAGGALRVGPKSAGAEPGPACYGKGGTRPTVTDANLLLGRLDPTRFLGGEMPLDMAAARRAIAEVAQPLGMELEAAALGIVAIANAAMERALRRVSVERGHDPRDFTLLPFGGAGPLHGCALADALGIQRIVIPTEASVLSALGMLLAPHARERSRALQGELAALDEAGLQAALAPLVERLEEQFAAEGERAEQWQATVACRYAGQGYELPVPLPLPIGAGTVAALGERFHALHAQRYGARFPDRIESVTLRVRAEGAPLLERLPDPPTEGRAHRAAPLDRWEVWLEPAGTQRIFRYERAALAPGAHFMGPALLLQPDTTTLLLPRWDGQIDPHGQVLLTRRDGDSITPTAARADAP